MLSATVPGHDAAFLSLLFQTERPRLEVFRRLAVDQALPGTRVHSYLLLTIMLFLVWLHLQAPPALCICYYAVLLLISLLPYALIMQLVLEQAFIGNG